MRRLQRLPPELLDAAQLELYDEIAGGPRATGTQHFALTAQDGGLNGPFDGFLRSPALGGALQRVGTAVRYASRLTARVREAAILLVSAHWDSAFELHAHEAVGRSIGLTDDDLTALRDGRVPPTSDEAERARLEVVRALLRGDLSDDEWDLLAPVVGEQDLFELTTLVGYYATLALQLRVFRVAVDE